VLHNLGWREWALSDGSAVRRIVPEIAPVSTALGVLDRREVPPGRRFRALR